MKQEKENLKKRILDYFSQNAKASVYDIMLNFAGKKDSLLYARIRYATSELVKENKLRVAGTAQPKHGKSKILYEMIK